MFLPLDERTTVTSQLESLLWARQSDTNQPSQNDTPSDRPGQQPDQTENGGKKGLENTQTPPPQDTPSHHHNPDKPSTSSKESDDHENNMKSSSLTMIIVGVIIIAALSAAIASFTYVRNLRNRRAKPRYLPGKFLKQRWENWTATAYSQDLTDNDHSYGRNPSTYPPNALELGRQSGGPGNPNFVPGVGRSGTNTSVRSIATLPAYSPAARDTERILGREGERAGVDVVLEYPETAEEEENRREDEMSSLYAIRVARRAEAAEREQRRQTRREQRTRGNSHASSGGVSTRDSAPGTSSHARTGSAQSASMLELGEAAQTTSGPRASELISAHQARDRNRRVSSVNYFDLGVAHHDGTRLRGNSAESDQRPLLDSAASFGGQSGGSRHPFGTSTTTLDSLHHSRGRSGSSAISVDTATSDDILTPPPPIAQTHTRSGSRSGSGSGAGTDFEFINFSQTHSRTGSQQDSGRATSASSGDLVEIPLEDRPPQYEQHGFDHEAAPSYESPTRSRAPGTFPPTSDGTQQNSPGVNEETPSLDRARLPSITVTRTPSTAAINAPTTEAGQSNQERSG